jgi:hypothetical protein
MDIHNLHSALDRNITALFPGGDATVFGVARKLDRSNDFKQTITGECAGCQ